MFFTELDSWPDDSLAIRKCEVLTQYSAKLLMKFWPKDCQKMMRIGPLAVRDDYQGFVLKKAFFSSYIFRGGLATKLWLETMRLAKEKGFQFVDSICAAKASTAVSLKVSFVFCGKNI